MDDCRISSISSEYFRQWATSSFSLWWLKILNKKSDDKKVTFVRFGRGRVDRGTFSFSGFLFDWSLFVTFFGASFTAPLLGFLRSAPSSTPVGAFRRRYLPGRTSFPQIGRSLRRPSSFEPEHWDSFGRILSSGRRALFEVGFLFGVWDREDSTLF